MFGYIYLTTNKINGKKYIGQHEASKFDPNYKGSGKLIRKAISKYGLAAFDCRILESLNNVPTICETREELNNSEAYYIDYYKCTTDPNYYNLVDGGLGKTYSSLTEDQKRIRNERLSRALKGRTFSEEHKRKISEKAKLRTGARNSNYGKHTLRDRYASGEYVSPCLGIPHTEEYKKMLSEIMKQKGIHKGKDNPAYGKHWYTNGKINVFTNKCPKGYKKGRVC